jgi:hypothetical protein
MIFSGILKLNPGVFCWLVDWLMTLHCVLNVRLGEIRANCRKGNVRSTPSSWQIVVAASGDRASFPIEIPQSKTGDRDERKTDQDRTGADLTRGNATSATMSVRQDLGSRRQACSGAASGFWD